MALILSPTQLALLQIHNNTSQFQFNKPQFLNLSKHPFTLKCSYSEPTTTTYTNTNHSDPPEPKTETETELETETEEKDEIRTGVSNPFTHSTPSNATGFPPPLLTKRKRYRKEYPGESKGITEEMRFVAMRLKNDNVGRRLSHGGDSESSDEEKVDGGEGSGWEPSLDGFVKYLVDSKLVFDTIERVVEESNDVSYAYFRRTGLERSEGLARDLEWFRQQNVLIPEPNTPGVTYAAYLKQLSEKSAPSFLCHFYNIYFSHIAGGQVIAKQVVEKLLPGDELNFYKWDQDAQDSMKDVREKLNRLSEHWTREDKNKCLKEATKSFRYMGQIVRLIIL